MTTRTLTIEIDPAGLRGLAAAGQLVAMVKSATNPDYAVVWQALPPLAQSTVSWAGTYQVYASTTALAAGAALSTGASGSATGGSTYTFAGGQFDGGTPGLSLDQIGLHNQDGQVTIGGVAMVTGGAGETALVNGESSTGPLDAQAVPYLEHAFSLLTELVQVFPAGGVAAGTVLDRSWLDRPSHRTPAGIVLGAPLTVDLTSQLTQTIHYNDATNAFVPGDPV